MVLNMHLSWIQSHLYLQPERLESKGHVIFAKSLQPLYGY